ncbi:MAG TPA: DUF4007 family protein [Oscillatoriaceae cyanobacterium M33_DOE_052]|uniref:DUF4007 family protein n=1 Tax=Planktothricoides sp. SpSt-374 TaxID=2282167 RepID=A0A7C3ZZ60_9CYAN|nr:DUF4007 family protein [Oscillatoriaceae cyanobacterium M33_DOE_052]
MTQFTIDIPNLGEKVLPIFARHETFHPRFGWIKKGFDKAKEDSDVFLAEDATVRLGVGKNMVRSIRYWCRAFKVLVDDKPTEFGMKLLDDQGWDPFLEDPASLWLLHWNLLKPTCEAAAWYFTFNVFRAVEFSANDLFMAACNYRETLATRGAESSINKDVTCILRMYVEQLVNSGPSEDSLDCPFSQLGLIHTAGDAKQYTFRIGQKRNLPPEIVVAACLEYADLVGRKQRTIALSRLLYDMGSPGMVFKLSESALSEAIEQVARQWDKIAISDSAGLIQFYFTESPRHLADEILEQYYHSTRRGHKK